MSLRPPHAAAIRAFDYAAALALGATACLGSWWIVPDGLPGIVAMMLGMFVGLVVVLPLFALLNWILSGFELVMMGMQVAMLAGMGGPMIMGGTPARIALAGAGVGFVVQLLLHALDRSLHGEVAG
jgi:hypothetical protein